MRAAILAGLGAAFHVLVFPPFGWTWLAWLAPLPVLLMSPAPGAAAAAAAVWLFGTLWALGVVAPWMTPALHALFGLSNLETAGLLVLVCQCGVPFALLGWLLHAGRPATPLARVLYAPAAWVAVEYLRAHVPFGTPWALLGSALAGSRTVAQIADLGGAYAITFVLVLASAAVAELLRARTADRRGIASAVTAALVVLTAAAGYGGARRAAITAAITRAPTARVALVHAEIPNGDRQDPAHALAVFERYLALDATVPAGVDLVVWPENAVPLLLEDNPELVARIRAQSRGVPRVIGAPRMVTTDGRPSLRASAFLVDADGIAAVYDKHRLLVLAETMPAFGGGGLLSGRGFVPGAGPTTLAAGTLRLAPLVCYEFIFPELPRAAVRDGASLIANLSNDSWFRPGAGPRQHLLFGRLRTVELRRTMVRAANLGPTTVILPDGTTVLETDGITPGVEVADVPLLDERSVYARVGDLFAWSCIGGVGLALARRRHVERVRHGRAEATAT
jgi:apolipoprotein N-acyltransferase